MIHRVESIFHDVGQATKTLKDRTSKLKYVKVEFNDQKNRMHAIDDLYNELSNIQLEHETTGQCIAKEIEELEVHEVNLLAKSEDVQRKKHILRKEYEANSKMLIEQCDEARKWIEDRKEATKVQEASCSQWRGLSLFDFESI